MCSLKINDTFDVMIAIMSGIPNVLEQYSYLVALLSS